MMEPHIPIELLEQFERGNVLIFVGEGIHRGALPSSAELAQELARRCDYPPDDPVTLPRVAGYYEMMRDRNGLIQFLRDRLDNPALKPQRAHQLITQLGARVIVTTCYDRLLELALKEANIPCISVVGNTEVAYADESKVLLVWLWGVLDQPASLVVTEDDRRRFLEGRTNLSDVLRGELARRTWLFVGFDAEDEWFRGFYDSVSRGLDRQSRCAYIFGAPSAYARAWWEKHNARVIGMEVESFLVALTEQLAARRRPPAPAVSPGELRPAPLAERPYKLLDYYEAQDASIFFGRQQETQTLSSLIHAHRLVLLYGASGVGKTSLLLAGAVPRLEQAEPPYEALYVRTLQDPTLVVRRALQRRLPEVELPAQGSLVDLVHTATKSLGRALVIILDQFEEFFIRLSPEFRAAFIAELGALYDAHDVPVKVVLSLREDWLASVGDLEKRIPEVFRIRMRLLPLTREQAYEAIVCPIKPLGYSYEPAVLETLLNDLTREGIQPPQLQLVCSTLFQCVCATGSKTIGSTDYQAVGGAEGVLRGYLEEELRQLGQDASTARVLLEELVTSQGTKATRTVEELAVSCQVDSVTIVPILERLVRRRLLRPLYQHDVLSFELAHEYLIHEIGLTSKAQERKQAEEMIAQEVQNWHRFHTLLPTDKLALVKQVRDLLRLGPEAQELLLRSAIHNRTDVDYWLAHCQDRTRRTAILAEYARSDQNQVRSVVALAWGELNETEAVEPLLELALHDKYPGVRGEAAHSLQRLAPRQTMVVSELCRFAQAGSRDERKYAFEALAAMPLAKLPLQLRWRVLITRIRITLQDKLRRTLSTPVRQFSALLIGLAVLVILGLYAFSSSSYHLAVIQKSDKQDWVIVVRGHPAFLLPGLSSQVADTGHKLGDFTAQGQRSILVKAVNGFWWQKSSTGLDRWEQQILALLSPMPMVTEQFLLGDTTFSVRQLNQWLDSDIKLPAVRALEQVMLINPEWGTPETVDKFLDLSRETNPELRLAVYHALGSAIRANPASITPKTRAFVSQSLSDSSLPADSARLEFVATVVMLDIDNNPVWATREAIHVFSSTVVLRSSNSTSAAWQIMRVNPGLADQDLIQNILFDPFSGQVVNAVRQAASNPRIAALIAQAAVAELREPSLYYGIRNYVGDRLSRIAKDDPALAASYSLALVRLLQVHDSNVDPGDVYYALRMIVDASPNMASPELVQALGSLTDDSDVYTRQNAVLLLGRLAGSDRALATTELLAQLMRMLSSEDFNSAEAVSVWAGMAQANPQLITPEQIIMVSRLLGSNDLYVRANAVRALARVSILMGNTQLASTIVPAAVDLVGKGDGTGYPTGAQVLGLIASKYPQVVIPAATDQLIAKLETDDTQEVEGTLTALEYIIRAHPPAATPKMYTAIESYMLLPQQTNQLPSPRDITRPEQLLALIVSVSPDAMPKGSASFFKSVVMRVPGASALWKVSWIRAMVLSSLTNPNSSEERETAGHLLFSTALHNPETTQQILRELEALATHPDPNTRVAANRTLQMVRLAEQAQRVSNDPVQRDRLLGLLMDLQSTESCKGSYCAQFLGDSFYVAVNETIYWLSYQTEAKR